MSLWTDDDSRDLDAQIKRLRKPPRDRALLSRDEQRRILRHPVQDTLQPLIPRASRKPRPVLTPSLLRPPQPRLTSRGRWLMVLGPPTVKRRTQRTFDTPEEATQWRDQHLKEH